MAPFWPSSPEAGKCASGGAPEFTSSLRNSCPRGRQSPALPGKQSAAHPALSRHGEASGSPRVPTVGRAPRARRLRGSTTSLPLGAEASEEVMSRAATAPQLQAPQPDISAGPRPGFSPALLRVSGARVLLAGRADQAPDPPANP